MQQHFDARIAAINHPTRRAILQLTLGRERSAGELAEAFSVTRVAVSQHIRLLVDVGLLDERRERQRRLYRVNEQTLAAFRRDFDAFWARGLRRLKTAVETKDPVRPRPRGRRRG